MKITLWNVWRNNFYVRTLAVERLIKLRELFSEEMERAGEESGSQLSYKVGDDFQGLGEIRESGAIGVHEKSVACGRCSSMCFALNELQLAICEIRGDPESHWKKVKQNEQEN